MLALVLGATCGGERDMRIVHRLAVLATAIGTLAGTAEAQRLAVRLPSTVISWGSGLFSNMQGAMTSAFGGAANVSTFTDINSLAVLSSSTALYLDLGPLGNALTATEQATLSAYIASGRRVFFLGENSGWASWNSSFLSVVGGAAGPDLVTAVMSPIVNNEITAGVTSVTLAGTGSATGGTQLFDANVMQLRGAQQNVFSSFDYNAFNNASWALTSNARLGQNVSAWLAGSPTVVIPEPSSYALIAGGLVMLTLVRRRRA
jgi:hypothetical protein